MRVKPTRTQALLLLNACVLAVCVAFAVLLLGDAGSSALDPAAIQHDAQPPVPEAVETGIGDVLEKPLFRSSRRPVVETSTARSVEAPAPEPSPPLLIGVVLDAPGMEAAVLEDPSSATRKLVPRGQAFAGWILTAIHESKAELRSGDKRIELKLPGLRSDAH